MNKEEFLGRLRSGLSGLPGEDIEERVAFYAEMIDDRTEEGLTEEEAVAEIGSVDEVVSQIVSETPLAKIVKEKVRPKRSLKAWEVVLLILGAPIWGSLLIAAAAVIFSFYVSVWAIIISLWAVMVSFAAAALAAIAAAVFYIVTGHPLTALASLGAGLFLAGVSVFLFFGCKELTAGILKLTKKAALGIKSLFIGKEDVK